MIKVFYTSAVPTKLNLDGDVIFPNSTNLDRCVHIRCTGKVTFPSRSSIFFFMERVVDRELTKGEEEQD